MVWYDMFYIDICFLISIEKVWSCSASVDLPSPNRFLRSTICLLICVSPVQPWILQCYFHWGVAKRGPWWVEWYRGWRQTSLGFWLGNPTGFRWIFVQRLHILWGKTRKSMKIHPPQSSIFLDHLRLTSQHESRKKQPLKIRQQRVSVNFLPGFSLFGFLFFSAEDEFMMIFALIFWDDHLSKILWNTDLCSCHLGRESSQIESELSPTKDGLLE